MSHIGVLKVPKEWGLVDGNPFDAASPTRNATKAGPGLSGVGQNTPRTISPRKSANQSKYGDAVSKRRSYWPYKSKLEADYANHLDCLVGSGEVKRWRYESIRLVLADGVRVTPDFWVEYADGRMGFVEVTWFMRDEDRVNFRLAREMFPWPIIVARKGNGCWLQTDL